ncbi:MAG: sugar phosphate isomerase/epimerase family protein [Fimbriiglobus sp.]
MFKLSAFADEISPDPREQIRVLQLAKVKHIEFRSIHKTNVLALTDAQIAEFQKQCQDAGIGYSAIGSPIGKVAIDASFEPHLEKFQRAIELAHRLGTPNIRIFSYYPPANTPFSGDWSPYRDEILRRMNVKAEIAAKANITLFHENEHKIYGDSPERVADIIANVSNPALQCAYDAANWVYCGYDPIQGWELTKHRTTHLHIKDWKTGEEHGVIAGTGHGHIPYSIAEAVKSGYHGFAVMEPHLRGGGPTGGVTGGDLFPYAVAAFRKIVEVVGGVTD